MTMQSKASLGDKINIGATVSESSGVLESDKVFGGKKNNQPAKHLSSLQRALT